MWDWWINLLTTILNTIADLCGDWGLAIIILTLIIRLLITPLMTRSTASSARMQALQPKMKEIQEKYADDQVRMNEELQKFYSENKFNPLGGCLPLIIQMPIFFGLFTTVRNIGSQGHFYNIISDLSQSASGAISASGIAGGWVYALLVVAFGVLTLIPMLMNAKNTPEEQRSQTLIMGAVMAVMMLWIGWSLPSAVILYYDTSAIWQVVQQKVVTQRVMNKVKKETEEKLAAQPVQIDVVRKERKPRPKKSK